MTKVKFASMTAEIKGGVWVSSSKSFETWLNIYAGPAQVEGGTPNLEAGMVEEAKKLFRNIEVLEPPKPIKYESGDFVY